MCVCMCVLCREKPRFQARMNARVVLAGSLMCCTTNKTALHLLHLLPNLVYIRTGGGGRAQADDSSRKEKQQGVNGGV